MQIIDISLPIRPGMPTYPGSQSTEFNQTRKQSGSRLTMITIDSHAGTHIDAPSHTGLSDLGVESFSLACFYGLARVIEITGDSITTEELADKNIEPNERLLFRTRNSSRGYDRFYETWVGMEADAAGYLANIGVRLVGIDWFGIKQKDAPDNRAHTALLEKNIPIVEGIDLSKASEGEYIVSAFPVAFQGIDGAQARAVLIQTD